MGIKHTFTSGVADAADATKVRPTNWNADHVIDGDVDFAGYDILNVGNIGTGSYSSEAQQYFDRVTIPDDEQGDYATMIDALVDAGVWAKLDALYIHAAENEAAALENLVQDAYNCTNNGAWFVPYVGIRGPGPYAASIFEEVHTANGYVDTNFNPSTAVGALMTLNSVSLGAWFNTGTDLDSPGLGYRSGDNSLTLNCFDVMFGRICSNVSDGAETPITNNYGLNALNRSGASATQFYKNGVQLTNASSTTSVALPNGNLRLFDVSGFQTTNSFAVVFFGGSLTAGDHEVLYDAIDTYIDAARAHLTPSFPDSPHNRGVNVRSYGAVGDGIVDDTEAFIAFARDYQGETVELWVPPGTYSLNSGVIGGGDDFGRAMLTGIGQVSVWAYGVSFTRPGANSVIFGSKGHPNDGTDHTARIATTTLGALTVTLLDVGDASKFAVGDWIKIYALDLQGTGYPPNHYYYQFTKITNISGTTISFSNHIKYVYSADFPLYWSPDSATNNADPGGPATIARMGDTGTDWGSKIILYGVTWGSDGAVNGGVYAARDITYVDNIWLYPCCPQMGDAQSMVFERCQMRSDPIEVDKDIEFVAFRNCDLTFTHVLHQSSAPDHLLIENCNFLQLDGTPKNCTIINSHIGAMTVGPRTHGVTENLVVLNSHINSISDNRTFHTQAYSDFTSFSNGMLTLPKSVVWTHAVPGARFTNNLSPPEFMILDVTNDDPDPFTGNALFHTTLPSTFNFGTTYTGATVPTIFTVVPCANITARNCTGSKILRDWCQATSGSPLYSYTRFLVTGAHQYTIGDIGMNVYGYIVSLRFNVIRAMNYVPGSAVFTSTGNDAMSATFGNTLFGADTIDINVEIAGERILTPYGNTGIQSGDKVPVISPGDFMNSGWSMAYNVDLSSYAIGELPIIDIEIITDQGDISYHNVQAPYGAGGHGF